VSAAVVNIVLAGLGGQGVLKASDIVAQAAFLSGADVKKSEIHGMSQRGGSVTSDVRFGPTVYSPMVPEGQADFLVVLSQDQVAANVHALRPGGVLIQPAGFDETRLKNRKALNVALLGILSRRLDLKIELWHEAIRAALPEKLHAVNLEAFATGRGGDR
jgi:indolepyruvate ferredoxin oxidoreductase beta subunit